MTEELKPYSMDGLNYEPHRCPVCSGNGLVMNGFYSQTSGTYATSSTAFEPCRSCQGTGIVWNTRK